MKIRALGFSLVMLAPVARAQDLSALAALERRSGGRLGVLAMDAGSQRTLGYRADERFPLCSTFKLLLVAQVLQKVDAGQESLTRILPYGPADLLAHAPDTRQHVAEGGMSVRDLCVAAIISSDNTAANLLLATLGGPAALTRFARALGDPETRLDRNEPALNTPVPGQTLDSTTPAAMLADLRKILLGDVLAPGTRAQLQTWLEGNVTGAPKLKAGLPRTWRVLDKTGNGAEGACNDIGLLIPPGRPGILVAAYYSGSKASLAERDAVLAEVGRLVAAELGPR